MNRRCCGLLSYLTEASHKDKETRILSSFGDVGGEEGKGDESEYPNAMNARPSIYAHRGSGRSDH